MAARPASARGEPLASGWVTHAVVAGFIASMLMLFGFALAYGLAALLANALPADRPGIGVLQGWLYALTHNPVTDLGRDYLYVAMAAYIVGGLLWAVVYARFAAPRLAGPQWWRGLCFALVPTVVSLVVLLPLLGGGLFGMRLGAGPLPALGNLLLHALYGITLGVMYGPTGYLSAEDGRPATVQERQMLAGAERVAAGAALVGGGVGLAVGVLAVFIGERVTGVLSGPAAGLVLGTVVAGVALGAFAGSLIGLPAEPEPADENGTASRP
jgi:hypothetical protein